MSNYLEDYAKEIAPTIDEQINQSVSADVRKGWGVRWAIPMGYEKMPTVLYQMSSQSFVGSVFISYVLWHDSYTVTAVSEDYPWQEVSESCVYDYELGLCIDKLIHSFPPKK